MPTDEAILGFSNKWYKAGIKNSQSIKIDKNLSIKIFKLPYFLASKIAAHLNRGENDFRTSKDIEDFISAIAENSNAKNDILSSDDNVRNFLLKTITDFLSNDDFIESISAHQSTQEDADNALKRLKKIIS